MSQFTDLIDRFDHCIYKTQFFQDVMADPPKDGFDPDGAMGLYLILDELIAEMQAIRTALLTTDCSGRAA